MDGIIRWYQNPHWCTKQDYVKGVIGETSIKGEEFINSGTYHKGHVEWGSSSSLREVPLSEIQEYLPDDHPDKFIVPLVTTTMTTEAELKVGNYVQITRSGNFDNVYYTAGEIWKIISLSSGADYYTSGIYVEKDGKHTQLCLKECTPVKTARYESPASVSIPPPVTVVDYTGRYLKALKDYPESINCLKPGQYAKILGYRGPNLNIKVPGSSLNWSASIENIGTIWELMPEGFDPEVPVSYKIGDWVKVIKTDKERFPGGVVMFNNIYQVKDVRPERISLDVKAAGHSFGNTDGGYWLDLDMVVKVNPKTMSKSEYLQEEATKRFPVGSSFIPAHTRQDFVKVESGDYFKHDGGEHVYLYYSIGTMKRSQGPCEFNSVVYFGGIWAEPAPTAPVTVKETVLKDRCDKYEHKVGGYVKFNKQLLQFNVGDIVQISKVYEDGDFEVAGSHHRWLKSRLMGEIIWLGMEKPVMEKVKPKEDKWIPKVDEWIYDDSSRVCLGKVTRVVENTVYAKWYDKYGKNLHNSGCCPISVVRKALPHEIKVVDEQYIEHPVKPDECFKEKDHRLQIPDVFPPMQMKTKKVKHKLLI